MQTHVKFILDVYTNKILIEYTEHNGQQIGDVSEIDFKRRKAELFNLKWTPLSRPFFARNKLMLAGVRV